MSIKIGVTGFLGRMGQAISRQVLEAKGCTLSGVFERKGHDALGQKASLFLNHAKIAKGLTVGVWDSAALKELDVVIDFSEPASSVQLTAACAKTKCAHVIGTTGFSKSQLAAIKKASIKNAVLISPNMSLGANLLFALAEKASAVLDDTYDIEVIEGHHRHKKDAPSGTARRLAERIADARGWSLDKTAVYGRSGISGERPVKQIGIHVIRAGEIIGDHTAQYSGIGEDLMLTHRATSRDAFAKGAVVSAKFLSKKRKGLFNMTDVLGV